MNRLQQMLIHHIESTLMAMINYFYLVLSELVVKFLSLGIEYQ